MKKQKKKKEKYSVLVMRNTGKVKSYTKSNFSGMLYFFIIFFGAASCFLAYNYYNLFLAHNILKEEHSAISNKVKRLEESKKLIESQLNELIKDKSQEETVVIDSNYFSDTNNSSAADEEIVEVKEKISLAGFSKNFKEIKESKELEIEDFKIDDSGSFNFNIRNISKEKIQGFFILVFLVENEAKENYLLAYSPDFTLTEDLDFTKGISYALASNHVGKGNVYLTEKLNFKEVLILAQNKTGEIVYNNILAINN